MKNPSTKKSEANLQWACCHAGAYYWFIPLTPTELDLTTRNKNNYIALSPQLTLLGITQPTPQEMYAYAASKWPSARLLPADAFPRLGLPLKPRPKKRPTIAKDELIKACRTAGAYFWLKPSTPEEESLKAQHLEEYPVLLELVDKLHIPRPKPVQMWRCATQMWPEEKRLPVTYQAAPVEKLSVIKKEELKKEKTK